MTTKPRRKVTFNILMKISLIIPLILLYQNCGEGFSVLELPSEVNPQNSSVTSESDETTPGSLPPVKEENPTEDSSNNELYKAGTFRAPFASTSAFNRPIGKNANYTGAKAKESIDASKESWGLNFRNGWSCAIEQSDANDPMVVVRSSDSKRGINLPYQLRFPKGFPTSAGIPDTSDGHVVIFDKTTGYTHEFYKFKWNNGNPISAIHRTDDPAIAKNPAGTQKIVTSKETSMLTGNGHPEPGDSKYAGNRAAGTSCWAGLVRGWEMTEPNTFPKHALLMTLKDSQFSHSIQWPANHRDSRHASNYGSINYGALIAIPPEDKGGPNLQSLGLTESGLRLAKTLVLYGGYVVDRSSHPNLNGDHHIPRNVVTDVHSDFNKILKHHLRVITNNSVSQQYSGGGSPIQF